MDDKSGSISVNEPLPGASRVLIVPKGCFFVVGDNREESIDSRRWEDPFVTDERNMCGSHTVLWALRNGN